MRYTLGRYDAHQMDIPSSALHLPFPKATIIRSMQYADVTSDMHVEALQLPCNNGVKSR